MSIFWNPRARQPQVWVYFFFIFITITLCLIIYNLGSWRAGQSGAPGTVEGAK